MNASKLGYITDNVASYWMFLEMFISGFCALCSDDVRSNFRQASTIEVEEIEQLQSLRNLSMAQGQQPVM